MIAGLRKVGGLIALSAAALQVAVGIHLVDLGRAANWIAIGGIIGGVIYEGRWMFEPKPAVAPPAP